MHPNNKNVGQYQKPNFIKNVIKSTFWLVIIGAVVVFFYWVYHYSSWFPIRNFNVTSNTGDLEYVTAEEINEILHPYRRDMNFISISLNEVKHKFEEKAWIDKVEVDRSWPDIIVIKISERKPLARWGASKNYLVDTKGNLFKGTVESSLITFIGAPYTEKTIFDLYEQINPLLQRHNLTLSKLEYTTRSTWIVYLESGEKIFLGRDNPQDKIAMLLSVWDQLIKSDSKHIQEIHMEYRQGFSVKY